MLNFIIKRLIYSILIIAGVILLTFVLFRVAAGDPAAAILGKNPSPKEIEDLRYELGADLPLFYGKWRKTEAFSSYDFSSGKKFSGIPIVQGRRGRKHAAFLKNEALKLKRNFSIGNVPQQCRINFRGNCSINGKIYNAPNYKTISVDILPTAQYLTIYSNDYMLINSIDFFREQDSAFNSQFFCSLSEIVSFKKTFPYISFFNFGRTIVTREPIHKILGRGVGPSLCLMIPIFSGEIILGICLALLATAWKGKWVDRTLMLLAISGMSVSYLVFIIAGQWYLGYSLNYFPVWGWGSAINLALPLIIGIASGLGGSVRFYRTVFVNELNKEYLRTAAAKGCSTFSVYTKHLLRNAAIPIITHATAALPFLFTGSLLLETFFGIPGLGYLGVEALNNSDLQLLKALVIISAILFVSMNTLADIAYAWADPRIRLK